LSGAGLSVESGLSLYRAADGLWENHSISEVCSWYTWKENFETIHRFYSVMRDKEKEAQPHAGHYALARLEAMGAVLVTQNVDTLLEKAGAKHVLHLHGRIDQMRCTACGATFAVSDVHPDRTLWDPEEDCCPHCHSHRDVKPGVVFFGEDAPLYAPFKELGDMLRREDVLAVVGTSGEVVDVAELFPDPDVRTWLFNPAASFALPDFWFDRVFRVGAKAGMPQLETLWAEHQAAHQDKPQATPLARLKKA
jgi:NAD-dependent deacetylase